jgi:hypothetical protein
MSSEKIKPNEISSSIVGILNNWTVDIQYGIIELTDEKAEQLKNLIENASPKRTKEYSKRWKIKVTENTFSVYEKTVYNQKHYRRTHLLEKSHVKRNHKGKVAAQVHIQPAAETVKSEYVEGIKKIIQTSQSAGGGNKTYKK